MSNEFCFLGEVAYFIGSRGKKKETRESSNEMMYDVSAWFP